MKALNTLVAAAALLTSVAATAQTTTTAQTRVDRSDAFGEFVYDSLGATPKLQLKAAPKADAKVAAEKDKAAVAKQDANQPRKPPNALRAPKWRAATSWRSTELSRHPELGARDLDSRRTEIPRWRSV